MHHQPPLISYDTTASKQPTSLITLLPGYTIVAICIESLTVENLRRFCGKHQLNLGQNDDASIDIVTGSNGAGKTTLADSIHLCLTGEFEDDSPLVTFDLADKLSSNEEVTAKVSTTISDSKLGRRFRFTRQFQITETRRGSVNSVDSLQVNEEKDGEWVDVASGEAVNTVFPLSAITFCKLDSETPLGFEDTWGGTSWSKLVEDVGKAGAQQAAARDVDLPGYFANNYDLEDEMLRRINDLLENIDGRYRVEERQDGLVGRSAKNGSGEEIHGLPAGQQILISQVTGLVAAEMMPASPPLIGDTIFARVSREIRKKLFQVVKGGDRQVLLFAIEPELEGLDVEPQFKVEPDQEDMSSRIVSLD